MKQNRDSHKQMYKTNSVVREVVGDHTVSLITDTDHMKENVLSYDEINLSQEYLQNDEIVMNEEKENTKNSLVLKNHRNYS
jgi:hypothetical protein